MTVLPHLFDRLRFQSLKGNQQQYRIHYFGFGILIMVGRIYCYEKLDRSLFNAILLLLCFNFKT